MGEGGTDAAAVEVDDVFAFSQGEDDALIESVGAVVVEQSGLPQQVKGITPCRQMTAQTSSGGVTDLQFPNQDGVVHPALVEIAHRFGVVIELLLIERGSQLQHLGRAGFRSGLRAQAREALAEGQPAG